MNISVIDGVIISDIEVKRIKNSKVVNFSFINKTGDHSSLIGCEAWGDVAGVIESNFKKGSKIVISGELRQNSYEKDGKKNSITRIRVKSVGDALLKDEVKPVQKEEITIDDDSEMVPF